MYRICAKLVEGVGGEWSQVEGEWSQVEGVGGPRGLADGLPREMFGVGYLFPLVWDIYSPAMSSNYHGLTCIHTHPH